MSEELLAAKLEAISQTLTEFRQEMKDEIRELKSCKHCTNAPSFREKFKLQTLLISTLGILTGGFFLLFMTHIQGK